METILLIAVFTLLSGLGDAQGFVHAGRVWDGGHFNWIEALKSAAGFQFGVFMYWVAVRHLASQGVLAPEVQTLFWFSAKTGTILFAFMWVRGTLPRFRYDQLMGFAWKFLFPVAVLNLLVTGLLVALVS